MINELHGVLHGRESLVGVDRIVPKGLSEGVESLPRLPYAANFFLLVNAIVGKDESPSSLRASPVNLHSRPPVPFCSDAEGCATTACSSGVGIVKYKPLSIQSA